MEALLESVKRTLVEVRTLRRDPNKGCKTRHGRECRDSGGLVVYGPPGPGGFSLPSRAPRIPDTDVTGFSPLTVEPRVSVTGVPPKVTSLRRRSVRTPVVTDDKTEKNWVKTHHNAITLRFEYPQ